MSGDAQVRAEEVEEVLNCIHALLVKISAALSEIEQALSKAREQLARRREEIERLRNMLEEVPGVSNHEFCFQRRKRNFNGGQSIFFVAAAR